MTIKEATTRSLVALLLGRGGPAPGSSTPPAEGTPETVFLIHGMGRARWSMWILGWRLAQAGYRVRCYGYPTPSSSLSRITQGLIDTIRAEAGTHTYHLVAHSLGNVVIRNGFRTGYPEGLGHVVMLAPPNRPARLARLFADNPLYRLATGEPGQLLGNSGFYESLPVPTVPFGVIAGTRAPVPLFDEPGDGVVTVASTRLAGMADWARIHRTHTFLMNTGDTFQLVQAFLRNGRFRAR